ncbi:hypothetical protein ABW19_dt0206900 [Dactylella cylindrospora]|nr:hypothetical protein ABW19_dt0206900 [Dactylella cylindrospora]
MYEEAAAVQDVSGWGGSKTGPFITLAYAASAENLLGGSHTPHKILAYAAGASGSKLAVTGVNLQKYVGKDMVIRRPGFKPQVEPIYSCDGPIEQIQAVHEMESKKPQPYILVRTQRSVIMLNITYGAGSTAGDMSFVARCVATISTKMTGGNSFLYFAVNPWQSEQIAIMDVTGMWSLWNFALKNSHRTVLAQTVPQMGASGSICESGKTVSWVNMVWGRSQVELIIATRTKLLSVNVELNSQTDLFPSIAKSIGRDVEIISLRRPRSDRNFVILLTNYMLHILRAESDIETALTWRHYRHPEDKTLCCADWRAGKERWFFLYSRHNPNISILRLSEGLRAFDTLILVLRKTDNPILSLTILEGSTEASGHQNSGRNADLFSIVAIQSKFDVWKHDFTLNPNVNTSLFRRPRKAKRAPISSEMIDTSDEDIGADDSASGDLDLGVSLEKLTLDQTRPPGPRTSVLNLGRVYREAFNDATPLYKTGVTVDGVSFVAAYIERVKFALRERNEIPNTGFYSILHLASPGGLFEDVDALVKAIQQLLFEGGNSDMAIIRSESSKTGSEISSAALGSQDQDAGAAVSLTAAGRRYDALAGIWLDSLPIDAPAAARLRRERLARMVSIDTFLCSLGAYSVLAPSSQGLRPTVVNWGSGDTQEVQSSGSLQPYSLLLGDAVGSSGASGVNSRASSKSRIGGVIPRLFLENFTPVTHSSPGDDDMEALLNDWNIEELPGNYQWRPLENIQQEAYEIAQRSRSRSRAGSRRRRAASAAGSDRMQDITASDRLPMTQPVTRSDTSSIFAPSSSQIMSSQRFPASQIQRGKFGDSRKAKKRRRTEGF